jgi:hypothetical protein
MKISEYKDIYSKIDTDMSMDRRIKDKLLTYESNENAHQKKLNGSYTTSNFKSFLRSLSRVTQMRSVLPSIAFLVFIVIALLGASTQLLGKNNNELSTGISLQKSTAPISNSTGDATETIYEDTAESLLDETAETPIDVLDEVASEASPVEIPNLIGEKLTEEMTESQTTEITETLIAEFETPTEETPATPIEIGETTAEEAAVAEVNTENPSANDGDFYFAYFDVLTEGDVKAAIPNLIVRLRGKVNIIDPADFTEIVLTRDGIPVENNISYSNRINQFKWGYEEITDFYFEFSYENREPGSYGLTGKYKGVPFTVYNKILESAITDTPAAETDLTQVGWMYFPDESHNPLRIGEIVFYFKGRQNSFYQADLTELKLTLNGQEIACSFIERAVRYYESTMNNDGDTSYNLVFVDEMTQSGSYVITGKYRGVPFTSHEIVIP